MHVGIMLISFFAEVVVVLFEVFGEFRLQKNKKLYRNISVYCFPSLSLTSSSFRNLVRIRARSRHERNDREYTPFPLFALSMDRHEIDNFFPIFLQLLSGARVWDTFLFFRSVSGAGGDLLYCVDCIGGYTAWNI